VEEHLLGPRMENGRESDLCSQSLPASCTFQQGAGSGAEKDMVQRGPVLEDDSREFMGNGENHMEVRCRERVLISLCEPLCTLQPLTLRAMPVAARVVGNTSVSAPLFTDIDMASQGLSPTGFDRAHGLSLLRTQWMRGTVMLTVDTKDIRHL